MVVGAPWQQSCVQRASNSKDGPDYTTLVHNCLVDILIFPPSPPPLFFQGNYIAARGYYKKALQLVPNSKLLKENLAKLDRLEKRLHEVQGRR